MVTGAAPVRFPIGYAGAQVTLDELRGTATWTRAHPEFRRRVEALMQLAAIEGVPLGIGTAWRIQPDDGRAGFASPGNSNHEGFPDRYVRGDRLNGNRDAVAADMVPAVSWNWMEQHLAGFHLRSFSGLSGDDEPWHIQPAEIPASRNYRTLRWNLASPPLAWQPPVQPPLPPEVTLVQELLTCNGSTFASSFPFVAIVPDGTTLTAIHNDFPDVKTRAVTKASFKAMILVGRRPGGTWLDTDFNAVFRTAAAA